MGAAATWGWGVVIPLVALTVLSVVQVLRHRSASRRFEAELRRRSAAEPMVVPVWTEPVRMQAAAVVVRRAHGLERRSVERSRT